jgi:hypothetical protein
VSRKNDSTNKIKTQIDYTKDIGHQLAQNLQTHIALQASLTFQIFIDQKKHYIETTHGHVQRVFLLLQLGKQLTSGLTCLAVEEEL